MTLLRFERRTYCLEGSCSIQLSYGAIVVLVLSVLSGHPDSNWGSPAPKAGAITGLRYAPPVPSLSKKDAFCGGVFLGGEGGIRTPGTLIEYDSLANCWFQPLTHLSVCFVRPNCTNFYLSKTVQNYEHFPNWPNFFCSRVKNKVR